MANHWAITIGINQYRHLQPLMHAQNDALFLHRFLTKEAGMATDNCILLSDLATSVSDQVVYPDKSAISEWIETITRRVQADDVLWFSFSGYGMQHNGADYLMPIDGDPDLVQSTGIALAELIETLAQLPTQNILLLLDINRSQGSFSGQTIGTEVIQLAKDRQIPTLLSCQPEQYSHETLGVRHGLFTAALLESLQQSCQQMGEISDYISKRLPELCEHHWRPIQNSVSLIPEAQRFVQVVPEYKPAYSSDTLESTRTDETPQPVIAAIGTETQTADSISTAPVSSTTTVNTDTSEQVLAGSGGTLLSAQTATESELNATKTTGSANGTSSSTSRRLRQDRENSRRDSALVPVTTETPATTKNGAKLRNWGLLALALLSIGAFVSQQPFARTARSNLLERISTLRDRTAETAETAPEAISEAIPEATLEAPAPEGTTEGDPGTEENATETPSSTSEAASSPEDSTDPESANGEDAAAETESAAETSAEPTSEDTPTEAAANANGEAANPTASSPETQALLAQASSALENRQYSEALIALQQVPRDQRGSEFSDILTKARAGAAAAEETNASVLTDARMAIQPTQASQFSDAIAKARTIQPGEPLYEQARADIRSWSQVILDIAEGRATSGNLESAIAAAQVMPRDSEEFYQKAQDRITFWQQRQQSRSLIAQAQQVPRSGQASTYQQGIVRLRQVPIEHPEYETAQRLADEWSQRIFSIAQARAAQGRQQAAIDAAILVPAGTTAYEPTQQAIRRWRAGQ